MTHVNKLRSTVFAVSVVATVCVLRCEAFEVVSNRPFAARCNGPLGAIKVVEPAGVMSMQATVRREVRSAAVQQAVTVQHNPAILSRAARPLRLLAQRGVIRGYPRASFPRPLVHVTSSEEIILPDLVAAQQAGTPIGDPGNQLSFTFEGFTEATRAALEDYLRVAVPVARRIYGPPAFNITVKIVNDPNVQELQGGYYDLTANEIHLAPMTGNFAEDTFVLIKLVMHAFHDDTVFFFDAWEEGFAGAAALAVQTTPGVAPGYNPYDPGPFYALSVYEPQNQPALGNSTFYPESGFGGMLVWRIAMARACWFKCYIEDPEFFSKFNCEYYRRYQPALAGDTPGLKDIAASVLPQVEGMSFYDWYERQYVLDTSIHVGPKLFTWNIPLPESVVLIVEHYATDGSGNEQPRGGQALTIYWSYDFSSSLYAEEGNIISVPASGEGAGEGFLIPTFFNIGGPQRITVQVDLNGLRAYYPYPYGMRGFEKGENNLYGAILGAVSGEVDVAGAASASDIAVSRGVWGTEVQHGNLTPAQLVVTFKTTDGDEVSRTVNVGWDSYVLLMRGGAQVTVTRTYARGVHMMSLPVYTLNPSSADVLGIPADTLLLARWDPRLGGTGRYRLWPDLEPFAPGKAFWLKVFNDTTVKVRGIPVDPEVDYPVPLQFGWNMVGVPYNSSVSLADLRVQAGTDPSVSFEQAVAQRLIQAAVFGYSMNRGYEQVNKLEPFQGYWVRCLVTSEVRLLFPPATGRTAHASEVMGEVRTAGANDAKWVVRLCARSAGGAGNVLIGQSENASAVDGDVPVPPAGPGGVKVGITQVDGRELQYPVYRGFSASVNPSWRVAIEGPPYAVVNVAVENVSTAPGTRLILKPLSTGNAWVANVGMEKAFTLDAGGKLILSVEADGESSNGGAPLLTCVTASAGEEGALVAYALARPAFIEAEILNIAGRSVKKLTTGSVQVSGRGTLVWNGLNQWGARVPAGLYLATLEARSPDGSRQRAIVPITMRRR
jgi:hypothetical protein